MARDSSGNYTSPSSSFVTGTTISSSVMNGKLDDLGSEITNSLDRNGKGGMLARLRGVDGTSALPAYAFTSETTLGLWRAGSGDLRAASNGTDIQKWSSTEVRVYQAGVFLKGLTATNSTASGAGVTSTGGAGGTGVVAAGGTGNSQGVNASGSGNGPGVVAAGGATGIGVQGVGGATSGAGGAFSATAGNSAGLTATGNGSGSGVAGTGGATGVGVTGTGGATSGVGGSFAAGVAATSGTRQDALAVTNGDISFAGVANPASTTAHINRLGPKNVVKAWAIFETGATSAVLDGFNISTTAVAYNGTTGAAIINFADDFASANYACVVTHNYATIGTDFGVAAISAQTAGGVEIQVCKVGGTAVSLLVTDVKIHVVCLGAQ